MISIKALGTEILELYDYRSQLQDYLRNRMEAIAPNLTMMVGEHVGARLISHAGWSLFNAFIIRRLSSLLSSPSSSLLLFLLFFSSRLFAIDNVDLPEMTPIIPFFL